MFLISGLHINSVNLFGTGTAKREQRKKPLKMTAVGEKINKSVQHSNDNKILCCHIEQTCQGKNVKGDSLVVTMKKTN